MPLRKRRHIRSLFHFLYRQLAENARVVDSLPDFFARDCWHVWTLPVSRWVTRGKLHCSMRMKCVLKACLCSRASFFFPYERKCVKRDEMESDVIWVVSWIIWRTFLRFFASSIPLFPFPSLPSVCWHLPLIHVPSSVQQLSVLPEYVCFPSINNSLSDLLAPFF